MRQLFYRLDFAIFTARFAALVRQTFSETGRRMESQEVLGHSSAVITQRYLHEWTGEWQHALKGEI